MDSFSSGLCRECANSSFHSPVVRPPVQHVNFCDLGTRRATRQLTRREREFFCSGLTENNFRVYEGKRLQDITCFNEKMLR